MVFTCFVKKVIRLRYICFYIYISDTDDYIIDTEGCVIPNFSKTLKFKEATYKKKTCEDRGVFANKIAYNKIRFDIQNNTMKRYSKGKSFNCCYKFAHRSTEPRKEDTEIM